MLNVNIPDLHEDTRPALKQLLVDFRRVQVSRFPIEVKQNPVAPNTIFFYDSRFMKESFDSNAVITRMDVYTNDKGRETFRIRGRLISNDKYKITHKMHDARETTNPKVMFKWMKEYILPFTSTEIIHKMGGHVNTEHAEWVKEPLQGFAMKVNGLTKSDIAHELMHLITLGVEFKTDKFREIATEGLQLYNEGKERQAIKTDTLHVFIQPDESLLVTRAATNDKFKKSAGTWTIEGMQAAPECIQQQIAMLRLTPTKQYVAQVGRMVDERTFWIHVNPDDISF